MLDHVVNLFVVRRIHQLRSPELPLEAVSSIPNNIRNHCIVETSICEKAGAEIVQNA
jgi:hypothetical protein